MDTWQQKLYRRLNGVGFWPSQYRYNLTISHHHRFIWFRVAKSGTRTVLNHLRAVSESPIEEASGLHYPVRKYSGYYKFAFVRNPWDRVVSCWLDKVVRNNFFDLAPAVHESMQSDLRVFLDYLRAQDITVCDRHIRLQSRLIDMNNINFIGRLEAFNADFAIVLRRLGLSPHSDDRVNGSPGRSGYRDYYDDETARLVGEIYERDIRAFGYVF